MINELPLLHRQWLDSEKFKIPEDDSFIYAIRQYKDGTLIDHVYKIKGSDCYTGIYKKVKYWMQAEELPKLPQGRYAIGEFHNKGDRVRAIK